MPRVGTCQGCGARFKIPDSVSATRARCKKCGGVVEIPPAEGAASAPAADEPEPTAPKAPTPAKPAAPKAGRTAASPGRGARKAAARGVPAKAPAVAPTKTAGRGTPERTPRVKLARKGKGRATRAAAAIADDGDVAAPTPRAARGPAGRRAGRGARSHRGGDAEKKKGMPLVPILIVVALLARGGGGWARGWFGSVDAPAPGDTGTKSTDDTSAQEAGADEAGAEDTADDGAMGTDDATPAMDDAGDDATTAGADAPAAAAPAEDDEDEPAPAPVEPLDPVISFEPLAMVEGTDPAQFEHWTELIHDVYIDPGGPRTVRDKKKELYEGDVVDQTPAYINAVIGMDMSTSADVINVYKLVDEWQQRVDGYPHFNFDGDVSKMEVKDINLRVEVFTGPSGWTTWWKGKVNVEGKLEEYREKLAARLAAGGGGDDDGG